MTYRVWDTDLGKLFGVYDTEEEALALVRLLAESHGDDVEDFTMSRERADGSFGPPESGAALVQYANEVAEKRDRVEDRKGELVASGPKASAGGSEYSDSMPMAARGGSASGKVKSFVENTATKALCASGRGRRRHS